MKKEMGGAGAGAGANAYEEAVITPDQLARMRLRYPGHIPVLVRTLDKPLKIKLRKQKFMVGADHLTSTFCSLVRTFIADGVDSSTGLYFFCACPHTHEKCVVPMSTTVGELNKRFAGEGPLIVYMAGEATFGDFEL
jgi:hypothetical protein